MYQMIQPTLVREPSHKGRVDGKESDSAGRVGEETEGPLGQRVLYSQANHKLSYWSLMPLLYGRVI